MANPYLISGVVSDNSGEPIAEARIYFTDSPMPMPDIAMLTDSNGKFTLSVPLTGKYGIGCYADGFAPKTTTVMIESGQKSHLEIRLTRQVV